LSGIEPEKFLEARRLGKRYLNFKLSKQDDRAAEVKAELESKSLYRWAFPRPATTYMEEIVPEPLEKVTFELSDTGRAILTETSKLDKPLKSKKAYFILAGMPESSILTFEQLRHKLSLSKAVLVDNLAELVYRGLVNRL
jgi:hypothetical protein